MADWFKLHENWFTEPRLQWAIKEQATVTQVWLWCLTECCKKRSGTVSLPHEDYEMLGIQQLLNISPGIFTAGLRLLEKIKYIETDLSLKTIKVLKWNDFQNEYLTRKARGDYDKDGNTPKLSDNIRNYPTEERRREEIRREEEAAPKGSALSLSVQIPDSLSTDRFKVAWEDWMAFRLTAKKSKDWNRLFSKQLSQLEEWGVEGAILSLKASTVNEWQGLFPPKNGNLKKDDKKWLSIEDHLKAQGVK